jgi:hypothetical protein
MAAKRNPRAQIWRGIYIRSIYPPPLGRWLALIVDKADLLGARARW